MTDALCDQTEWAERFASEMLRLGALTSRNKLIERGCTLWGPFQQITPEDLAAFEFQALWKY
jgi:hypothetical protein